MKRPLSNLIDDVVQASKACSTKTASANLSEEIQSPSISSELSSALLKVAEALKTTESTLSSEDLNEFLEKLSNG